MRIAHSSIDERGKASGGEVGNQNGKETCVREWYNKPWKIVLRHKELPIANNIGNLAFLFATPPLNKLLGYDQSNRNSFHSVLKSVGYSVAEFGNRNEPVESDCSAFVTSIAIAAGVRSLEYEGNAPTTSTMATIFQRHGFEVITDKKVISSTEYLKKGDILLAPGSHVVIAIENGKNFNCYPAYTGNATTLITALNECGIDSSKINRKKIYGANFTDEYKLTAVQNTKMLQKLKSGSLIRP